jgi:hypothetical protein
MTRTVEQLNEMADPILKRVGAAFVLCVGKLRIRQVNERRLPHGRVTIHRPALRGTRNWFRYDLVGRELGIGGTDEQTLCQLILWYRDLPRLPGYVLKNWQERSPDFCAAIDRVGYDDDKSTRCVICGEKPTGLDWWSLNGVTGPCCSPGRGCRNRVA